MKKLVSRDERIAAVFAIVVMSATGACSSSSGISPVDAGDEASTTGAPPDANCDPSLTYASFGMDFFATYCNRCHAWTQQAAQQSGSALEDFAGTSTSMPPSAPFPTPDQRMQLVNWIDCGAP